MATIHDVAKACGVSSATVSRVLNNNDKVREDNRQLVLETMEQLNYQPNILGRNLRKNENKMILIFLSTIVNPFYAKIVKGMEDVAHSFGYEIMLCATYDDREREEKFLELLKNRMACGAVFMTSTLTSSEMKKLGNCYNVVQCVECLKNTGIVSINIDNRKSAFDATCHLIEKGKKQILHINVAENRPSATERFKGYCDALYTHSIPLNPKLVIKGNYGYHNAYSVTKTFIDSNIDFDGIFAISDRMAAGAVAACLDSGISVPGDVAVVGFDNVDTAYISRPSLTTVSQNQYDMGRQTMECLLDILKGVTPKAKNIILEHELVVRCST